MSQEKNNNGFAMIAIVAIVAVVGIVMLFLSSRAPAATLVGGGTAMEMQSSDELSAVNLSVDDESNLGGEAILTKECNKIGKYYGCNNPPYTTAASCGAMGVKYYQSKGYINISLNCCTLRTWGVWDCYFRANIPPCKDSDGGKNIYVKGKTTGIWDFYTGEITPDMISTHEDLCLTNYGYVNGLPKVVSEYYCDSNGRKADQEYNCTYGCADGACKKSPANQSGCKDSDGANYLTKGYIVDEYGKTIYDACIDNDQLMEGLCVNNKGFSKGVLCSSLGNYACDGGRCIRLLIK